MPPSEPAPIARPPTRPWPNWTRSSAGWPPAWREAYDDELLWLVAGEYAITPVDQ